MTFEQIRATCPGARDTIDTRFAALVLPVFGGGISITPPVAPDYTLSSLAGSIGGILVETPEARTREGLGVGSTVDELRKRLGSMFVALESDVGAYAVPQARPRWGIYFFLKSLDPSAVPGGWTPDSAVYSDSVAGTAVVAWVEVHRPGR